MAGMTGIKGIPFSEELKLMRGAGSAQPKLGSMLDDASSAAEQSGRVSFGEFLAKQFSEANARGVEAEKAMQDSIAGRAISPHSTIIAVQKASIALTLMMGIKMRLERAYQELIRMQLG